MDIFKFACSVEMNERERENDMGRIYLASNKKGNKKYIFLYGKKKKEECVGYGKDNEG